MADILGKVFGDYLSRKAHKDGLIYHFGMEKGTTSMECVDVAPGIQISYNNLYIDSCFAPVVPQQDYIQIDYCIDGCFEFELDGGLKYFISSGDLSVTPLYKGRQIFQSSSIPLKKYHGITVIIDIEIAQRTLDNDFSQWKFDLIKLRDTLCTDHSPVLIKSTHETTHIFGEFMNIDRRVQTPYLWIKVIELLLFLSIQQQTDTSAPQQFSVNVTEATKQIYEYILEHPCTKEKITDLAVKVFISESSLKHCFKSMCGESIGAFMKTKRIEAAAEMIVSDTNLTIGEVAQQIGYENQGKFGTAFKAVYGMTPMAYRLKNT